MSRGKRPFFFLILGVFVLWGFLPPALAQEEKRVRAKIGIQIRSGDQDVPARARDRVKPGDLIRIYVHPEMSSYVYVVHTDQSAATLLNMTEQRFHSSTLVLPSVQDAYQVDGKSPLEAFTIICSPTEVKELAALSAAGMPREKWAAVEKDLMERSKIQLTEQTEAPFTIAGNVRGAHPFIKELQIFSGKTLLVKKYEFQVKK